MKKTLLTLSLSALALTAFARYDLVKSDKGSFYADGYVRAVYNDVADEKKVEDKVVNSETKKEEVTSSSTTTNFLKEKALRLRLGFGAQYKLDDNQSASFYARFQDDFKVVSKASDSVTKVNQETVKVKGKVAYTHDSKLPALTVFRLDYNADNYGKVTLGFKGTSDAADGNKFGTSTAYLGKFNTALDNVFVSTDRTVVYSNNFDGVNLAVSYANSNGDANQYALSTSYKYNQLNFGVVALTGTNKQSGATVSSSTAGQLLTSYNFGPVSAKMEVSAGKKHFPQAQKTQVFYSTSLDLTAQFAMVKPYLGLQVNLDKERSSDSKSKTQPTSVKTLGAYAGVGVKAYKGAAGSVDMNLEYGYRTSSPDEKTKKTLKQLAAVVKYSF